MLPNRHWKNICVTHGDCFKYVCLMCVKVEQILYQHFEQQQQSQMKKVEGGVKTAEAVSICHKRLKDRCYISHLAILLIYQQLMILLLLLHLLLFFFHNQSLRKGKETVSSLDKVEAFPSIMFICLTVHNHSKWLLFSSCSPIP